MIRNRLPWMASSILLALLLLAPGCSHGGKGPLPDPAPTDAVAEKAIDAVYPALVQIRVTTKSYWGGRERKQEISGSGAIISSEGHVITNHHVAGKAKAIKCILPTKEEIDAKLVGTDALSDISVIQLDLDSRPAGAPPLQVASFGSSAEIRVGDTVLAMGCPLALSQSVTQGIVANVDMIMPRRFGSALLLDGEDVGSIVKWIGHDAQILGGNSGGPLVNLDGKIVGINEISLGSFGGSMSGAIPSDLARRIADQLIQRGKIDRSWTGAEWQPLLKDRDEAGILVAGVISGSPAEKAGLRAGDIVLSVGGDPVTIRHPEELPTFNTRLLALDPARAVTLEIRRADAPETITIEPVPRDAVRGKEVEVKEWGITLREMTTMAAKRKLRKDLKGVIVDSIKDGGPSGKAEPALRGGDIIVRVGDESVETLGHFLEITKGITAGKDKPTPTVVTFDRAGKQFITLVEVGIREPQEPTPEVKKPWFPASTQVISKKLAREIGMKGKKGVRITQVYPESVAEKAGFQVGDILTHLDGQLIDASEPQDVEVFETMIRQYRVGSTAEISVIRAGETLAISLELPEAPKPERRLKVYEDHILEYKARDLAYLDRIDRRLGMDETGVLITQVESGGWAAMGDLYVGDIVKEIRGRPIPDLQALEDEMDRLCQDRPRFVPILVKRGIHTRFVELEPGWPGEGDGANRKKEEPK